MAADEAGDGQPRAGQRAGGARQANGDVGACAAGTADGEDALVLGVDVQHTAGGELRKIKALRALHADLLVDGKHDLKRRVCNFAAVQHGQRHGDGNAVVAAERRAVRRDIVALDAQVERVLCEVDGAFRRFFRNHVEMAL